MALCAMICGFDSWSEIALFAEERERWFRRSDFPHLILDFFSATFATRLTKFARFRDSHRLAPACGRYADDG